MKSTSGKMLSFQQHTFTWDVNFLVEVAAAAAAADIMCFVELFSLLKRARVCVCSRSVNMQFHFEHFSYSMCVLANAIIAFSLLLFSLMSFEKKVEEKTTKTISLISIGRQAVCFVCPAGLSPSLPVCGWAVAVAAHTIIYRNYLREHTRFDRHERR